MPNAVRVPGVVGLLSYPPRYRRTQPDAASASLTTCAHYRADVSATTPGDANSDRQPLMALIGGPRGALESILPPLAFVAVYVGLGDDNPDSLTWAIVAALVLAIGFAVWRLFEKKRPTRVIGAVVVVALGAYIAARTGSAAAFFWPRVLLNVLSAMAFVVGNAVRWPLLGVIVGPLVGTAMRWRKDPVLLRAYSRASWLWVLLNLVRAAVLFPLITANALWGLAASGAFFYLLVIATVFGSWVIIKRSIPADHPGIRHPVIQTKDAPSHD